MAAPGGSAVPTDLEERPVPPSRRRARRAAALLLSATFMSSSLAQAVVAVTPVQQSPDATPSGRRADGATVVERAPVDLGIPAAGGDSGGQTTDPSVLKRPALPGSPAFPGVATELPSERTQHTRTVANPDGTVTVDSSAAKLNFE